VSDPCHDPRRWFSRGQNNLLVPNTAFWPRPFTPGRFPWLKSVGLYEYSGHARHGFDVFLSIQTRNQSMTTTSSVRLTMNVNGTGIYKHQRLSVQRNVRDMLYSHRSHSVNWTGIAGLSYRWPKPDNTVWLFFTVYIGYKLNWRGMLALAVSISHPHYRFAICFVQTCEHI
jgi:hypothetical protein